MKFHEISFHEISLGDFMASIRRASVPLMLAGPVASGGVGGGRGYAPSVRGRVSKITVTEIGVRLQLRSHRPARYS